MSWVCPCSSILASEIIVMTTHVCDAATLSPQGYADLLVQEQIKQQVNPNLLTQPGRSKATEATNKWADTSEVSLTSRGSRRQNTKPGHESSLLGGTPLRTPLRRHGHRDDDPEEDRVDELLQRQNRAPPESPIQALHDRLQVAESRADKAEMSSTQRQLQLDEVHAKWRDAEAKLEEEKALRYSRKGVREMVSASLPGTSHPCPLMSHSLRLSLGLSLPDSLSDPYPLKPAAETRCCWLPGIEASQI